MATKKTQAGYEFLVSALKANKDAVYADLKQKAEAKGLSVFPIMFGRAKAALGLVKSKPRGAKKAGKSKAPAAKRGRPVDGTSKSGQIRALLKTGMSAAEIAKQVGSTVGLVYNVKSTSGQRSGRAPTKQGPAKRGPGRPKKDAGIASSLDSVVEALRENDRERARLSRAFEQIRSIIESLA